METTHQPLHTTSCSIKITVPFYAPPRGCKKTSAEIISEARAAIAQEYANNLSISRTRMAASIRPVNTKRPFTPRERERTLFGRSKKSTYRPPSSFSLDCLQFQDPESGLVTPPQTMKLNPLQLNSSSTLNVNTNSSPANALLLENLLENENAEFDLYFATTLSAKNNSSSRLKLPSIRWAPKQQSKRNQFLTFGSLGNLPEELEDENICFGDDYKKELPPPRKAYSSPTQRTQNILDGEFIDNVAVQLRHQSRVNIHPHIQLAREAFIVENKSQEKNGDYEELFSSTNKLPSLCKKKIPNEKEDTSKEDRMSLVSNDEENLHKTKIPENDHKRNIESFIYTDDENSKHKLQKRDKLFSLSKTKDPFAATVSEHDNENKKEKEFLPTSPTDFHSENSEQSLKLGEYFQLKGISIMNEDVCLSGSTCEQNKSSSNHERFKTPLLDSSIVSDEKESLQIILKVMSSLHGYAEGKERESLLIPILHKLYTLLESERALEKQDFNTKVKTQVLKVLYEFVEVSSDDVLLEIARIILALRVTGNNLSGVCKLIFKVSRNDENDKLFLHGNILELFVEALGSVSPLDDAEACVYGYGALKFITMNNILLQKVTRLGILELMVLHMKIINASRQETASIPEQTNHALFQLTGALRNVAGEEDMLSHFIRTGTVNELCTSMELFSSDLDVVSNISRIFSVISAHDDCCTAIVDRHQIFSVFVKLIQKYPGHQDITVRLGYAIGNLMAKSDTARRKFFNEEDAMNSLFNLLNIFLEKDQEIIESPEVQYCMSQPNSGSSGSVEDVIIKTVRIFANMSINAVVGSTLVWDFQSTILTKNRSSSFKEGGRLLDILLGLLRRKSVEDSEELVHSILITLNNLSYYPCNSTGSLGGRQLEIAQVLYCLLKTTNIECLIEANRVFGNLTRSKAVRDFVFESGGMKQLLKFLEIGDHELLCTTVGVLINMMADWEKRLAFRQENGIHRLIYILGQHGENDWVLATLICQALWNYCIESPDVYSAFAAEDMNDLLGLLADFLDDERLFGIEEGCEASECVKTMATFQAWEDFSGVATDLLERLEVFLDTSHPSEAIIENSNVQKECHLEPLYISDVFV